MKAALTIEPGDGGGTSLGEPGRAGGVVEDSAGVDERADAGKDGVFDEAISIRVRW